MNLSVEKVDAPVGQFIDFRHGRAPVGIRTGSDHGTVWVEVTDRGDGIAASDAEGLKQRVSPRGLRARITLMR